MCYGGGVRERTEEEKEEARKKSERKSWENYWYRGKGEGLFVELTRGCTGGCSFNCPESDKEYRTIITPDQFNKGLIPLLSRDVFYSPIILYGRGDVSNYQFYNLESFRSGDMVTNIKPEYYRNTFCETISYIFIVDTIGRCKIANKFMNRAGSWCRSVQYVQVPVQKDVDYCSLFLHLKMPVLFKSISMSSDLFIPFAQFKAEIKKTTGITLKKEGLRTGVYKDSFKPVIQRVDVKFKEKSMTGDDIYSVKIDIRRCFHNEAHTELKYDVSLGTFPEILNDWQSKVAIPQFYSLMETPTDCANCAIGGWTYLWKK